MWGAKNAQNVYEKRFYNVLHRFNIRPESGCDRERGRNVSTYSKLPAKKVPPFIQNSGRMMLTLYGMQKNVCEKCCDKISLHISII